MQEFDVCSERIIDALPILALFQELLSRSRSTRESDLRVACRHSKVLCTSLKLLSPPTALPLYDALTLTVALDFFLLPPGAVKLCEIRTVLMRLFVYVCVCGGGGGGKREKLFSLTSSNFQGVPPFCASQILRNKKIFPHKTLSFFFIHVYLRFFFLKFWSFSPSFIYDANFGT